ncbi:hypothetical protein G6F42_026045 [Rhizopus arrhizus]|nr:hypothetical protein G6F42_026045 [Rhizopus arrhizus]
MPEIKNDIKRKLYLLLEEPASMPLQQPLKQFPRFAQPRVTESGKFIDTQFARYPQHLHSPLSIIDFISIIPFYIEVIAKHDTTYEFRFTILRLFRLLRLFKSYKYSNTIVMTIEVMMMAFRRSGDALSALFFFTVTCVVLFSTLLYFAERGIWDETLEAFVASDGVPR